MYSEADVEFSADSSRSFSRSSFGDTDWDGQSTAVQEVKPNIVVRIWRGFKGFLGMVKGFIFSKEFWKMYIAAAIRDAFGGLIYSLGMRGVEASTGIGDLHFQGKRHILPGRGAEGEQAFSAPQEDRWAKNRAYGGVMDKFKAAPTGNENYAYGDFRGHQ